MAGHEKVKCEQYSPLGDQRRGPTCVAMTVECVYLSYFHLINLTFRP